LSPEMDGEPNGSAPVWESGCMAFLRIL